MSGFKLFVEAFRDLLWPLSPKWLFQKNHDKPVFAFIVHPRDLSDVYRKYPSTRVLSPSALEWFLKHFWPVVVSEVEGLKSIKNGEPIRGWILTIPLTAKLMMADRPKAVRFIRRAIKLAYCRGVNIVGLGALNASIVYRGKDIENLLDRLDMGLTSGVAFTAFNMTDISLYLIDKFKLNIEDEIFGIVGAAGAIGSATIKFLVTKRIRHFILIDLDRKHSKITELVKEFKKIFPDIFFKVTSDLSELKNCRFVITATNTPEALVKNEHLNSGTIIIDDAQPSDIDREVILGRTDVLVIEGGVIEVRGINPNVNLGLKHKTDVFSCLAEVMVLAAHDRIRERNTDYVNSEQIQKIGAQGEVLGFGRAEFQNFEKVYSEKDLIQFYERYVKSK